ncbi:MAG: ferredoxin [Blastococcus sp.]
MRLRVDPVKCQGYAICTEVAARHFTLDDWGYAQALVIDVAEADVPAVTEAIDECPVRAIRWIEGPATGAAVPRPAPPAV